MRRSQFTEAQIIGVLKLVDEVYSEGFPEPARRRHHLTHTQSGPAGKTIGDTQRSGTRWGSEMPPEDRGESGEYMRQDWWL